MRPHLLSRVLALAAAATGCASEETDALPPASECLPPNRVVLERCIEPGVQDDGCPAGTLGLEDGSCQPAGVPPEMCGDGFEANGDMGCEPILPAEPCPAGQMAVPGESTCHSVMACGAGKWGDIPIDATTVYVDASYAGLDSDGSSAKPFTTIAAAVAAAASDSLIAIAAGSYLEDVAVQSKKLRLWGKCPGEVELVGTGAGVAALAVSQGASGTEVHGLALRGGSVGFATSGAEDVIVDRLWVHDALGRGMAVESTLGRTSITVRGSLVERNRDNGIRISGAQATLEGVVVRGTSPIDPYAATGISIRIRCPGGVCDAAGATAIVRGSLVEENHDIGVHVLSSDATLESVVVRRTLPGTDGTFGRGVAIEPCTDPGCNRATAIVRGSLVDENRDVGVFVMGSDATLEGVTVRRTQPQESDQLDGWGIDIQLFCDGGVCDPAARANAVVRGSLVEENHELGLVVASSDATLEGVLVRGTLPEVPDQGGGRGIEIESCTAPGCDASARSTALLRGSLAEENHDMGVFVMGSDATLEGLLVRRTLPAANDLRLGRGLGIQLTCRDDTCDPAGRATALVRGSRIEENHDVGVFVGGADATLEGLLVQGTLARQSDDLYGDGFIVFSLDVPASATVTSSRIEASVRAGLSNFGATLALGRSEVACNGIDLVAEPYREQPFRFENLGENACGCPDPAGECKAHSVGLEAPAPITDSD